MSPMLRAYVHTYTRTHMHAHVFVAFIYPQRYSKTQNQFSQSVLAETWAVAGHCNT